MCLPKCKKQDQQKKKCIEKDLAVNSQVSAEAWHTGLSDGALDRLVNGEVAGLGNRRSCTAIIHRTVRWCTGQSGESSTANSSLSGT